MKQHLAAMLVLAAALVLLWWAPQFAAGGGEPDPGPREAAPATFAGRTAEEWAQLHARENRRRLQEQRNAEARAHTIRRQRAAIRRLVLVRSGPFGSHPLERSFLCIKSFEGAWTSNTGNGYYGGLQMDRAFMRKYGKPFLAYFGTADKWPVSVQLAVSMRAYVSGRGFTPWPTTRWMCGL